MKLKNSYLGLQLSINNDLLIILEKEARKFYPNEYGGLLLGNYNNDRTALLITDTILSSTQDLSRTKFDRVINEEELFSFYDKNPDSIYVGEWHSHPNSSCLPSVTDLFAMYKIANHPTVLIENPILVIQSIYEKTVQFCFYVYFKNKIYQYEVCKL